MRIVKFTLLLLSFVVTMAAYGQKSSGNPIFAGDYADPEGVVFGKTYWIYPTFSAAFDDQLHFDCFSSKDLVKWTKHERIIDNSKIKWLRRALWAPAAVEKDGKYYLFFGANDVHEGEIGGIGVAVAVINPELSVHIINQCNEVAAGGKGTGTHDADDGITCLQIPDHPVLVQRDLRDLQTQLCAALADQ